MFTGLVQDVGRVVRLERVGDGARLTIATPLAAELAPGDSIAVNGVCLTAIEPTADAFHADAIPQTLEWTTTGELGEGDPVDLELALRAGDRLGGHHVQGHVDAVGTVAWVHEEDLGRRIAVDLPEHLADYVVERGSITLAGVSLTLAAVDGTRIEVGLIPETLERTVLGHAEAGSRLNVEVDAMAKQVAQLVERHLQRREGPAS